MDDKTLISAVPPYEASQTYPQQPQAQHSTSFGSVPGQPQVQHDIYQSPMPTGQTAGTTTYQEPPAQQPTMATNEKQEYYTGAQPVDQMLQQPMAQQQMPTQGIQMQPSIYQTATPLGNLSEAPAPANCPVCRQRALTRVEYKAGNTTHVWAIVICLISGLGCIPYLVNGLKDIDHKCGNCGVLLATWKKSGRTVVHQHA